MRLEFDDVIAWLEVRCGQRVFAATQPNAEVMGNTRLSVTGVLVRQEEGEVALVEPAPGRVEVFRVGDGTLVLLEGEFRAGVSAPLAEGFPEIMQLDFGDVLVTVGPAPDGG